MFLGLLSMYFFTCINQESQGNGLGGPCKERVWRQKVLGGKSG